MRLPIRAQTNWINWLNYFGDLLKCKNVSELWQSLQAHCRSTCHTHTHTLLCYYFKPCNINIRNLTGQAFDSTFSLCALLVKFASQQNRCSHQLSAVPPFISRGLFRAPDLHTQRAIFFFYLSYLNDLQWVSERKGASVKIINKWIITKRRT